jgi:hypothetical protein
LVGIVLFGGESIRFFSMALLVGITAGTYSSIYVASALLVTSYAFQQKRALRNAVTPSENGKKKQEKKEMRDERSREGSGELLIAGESVLGAAPALSRSSNPSVSQPKHQKKKKRGRRR